MPALIRNPSELIDAAKRAAGSAPQVEPDARLRVSNADDGRGAEIETVFSMLKRNLGSALRAKSNNGRRRDMYLRVLTHNLAIALVWVFYSAIASPYPPCPYQ